MFERLDELQKLFDSKHLGAEIYYGDEHPYIECTKAIKPVKVILEKNGIEILNEYESCGSDYDSYIIELDLHDEEE